MIKENDDKIQCETKYKFHKEIDPCKSFEKSIFENTQLVFSKKITISTTNPQDELPISEILDIQEIKHFSLENKSSFSALLCHIDNRTIFYNSLIQNSIVYVANYFPLSREKFKMNCLIFTLSGNGQHKLNLPNENQISSILKINFKLNKFENLEEKNYLSDYAKPHVIKCMEAIKNQKIEDVLNGQWAKLGNEAKLDYETVDKDSIKSKINEGDLDKYEAQEEIFYSKNFSLLYLIPIDTEHMIFPMPQVVANSRKPEFESLIKPHRKPKKYLFTLNFMDEKWNLKELYV